MEEIGFHSATGCSAAHAARVGLQDPVVRIRQVEGVEQFVRPLLGLLAAEPVQPAEK